MNEKASYPHIVTEAFLYLSLSVYLLFPGFHGYGSIQDEKALFFYILFGAYVLLMLPTVRLKQMKRPNAPQLCALLYLLFTALSALLSPYGVRTVLGMGRHEGLLTISLYVLSFLYVSAFAPVDLRRLWVVLGISMSVFCILCLAQMLGENPLGLYPDGLDYFDANNTYSGIYLGTIGNIGLVGVILCLSIPIFAAQLADGKNLFSIPLTGCLLVLVLMDAKAPIVGLLAGAALCLPALLPISKRFKWVLYSAMAAGAAALIVYAVFFAQDGILREAGALLRGQASILDGSGRIYIWQQILSRVPSNLWFGTGPDTMLAAQIPGFAFGDGEAAVSTVVDLAHNEYLNILYHQGLPALVSYGAMLAAQAAAFIRRKQKPPQLWGLFAALLSCCIQAFFGLSICLTAAFFWLLLGILNNQLKEELK